MIVCFSLLCLNLILNLVLTQSLMIAFQMSHKWQSLFYKKLELYIFPHVWIAFKNGNSTLQKEKDFTVLTSVQ